MRIAILDDYQNAALACADWARLPEECEITVFNAHMSGTEALAERLRPFDIICANRERTPFPAELIARLPNLKLIVTTGLRNASIDVAAARLHGVTVCGTRSRANGTVELAIGLIVGLRRGLFAEHRVMKEQGWQRSVGGDLEGATLGILGLGRLGSRVAPIAHALGMRVLAWSFNMTEARAAKAGVSAAPLEQVLAESDAVSIHLRLSEQSRGLIGARELALMKPSAYLVNTARGPIVDTQALIDAVTSGRLAGAALDVYDEEPLPLDHPLRQVPQIYLTPHIGFVTQANYRVFYEDTLEAIEAFLNGEPVRVLD